MARATMATTVMTLLFVSFAVLSGTAAADPGALQDVCVADLSSTVKVNGYPCKANVTEWDFFTDVLNKAGNTTNKLGSTVTPANVLKVPGLNTLGISMGRIDLAPGGVNPLHTHPRANEVFYVLKGCLEVGFITTGNVLITKNVTEGDMFAFPKGLLHYQRNLDEKAPAAAIVAFNSQNPGTQSIAASLFAVQPAIDDYVLRHTFQVGNKAIEKMRFKN